MNKKFLKRIEVFYNDFDDDALELTSGLYLGLSFYCSEKIIGPVKNTNIGYFYFTHKGWNKFGKEIIQNLIKANMAFIIQTIYEKHLKIKYRDKYQISGFLKKKIH